jgi:hypothetical protein
MEWISAGSQPGLVLLPLHVVQLAAGTECERCSLLMQACLPGKARHGQEGLHLEPDK